VIESIERSLSDVFPPQFPFDFDVPQFRKLVLHFVCFYTACKSLNPFLEFYMPPNGALFDGSRMIADELGKNEENANVLFSDKFGVLSKDAVVIKPSVMCM
jgi:hypothetical protein